jgi:hypothetical protein
VSCCQPPPFLWGVKKREPTPHAPLLNRRGGHNLLAVGSDARPGIIIPACQCAVRRCLGRRQTHPVERPRAAQWRATGTPCRCSRPAAGMARSRPQSNPGEHTHTSKERTMGTHRCVPRKPSQHCGRWRRGQGGREGWRGPTSPLPQHPSPPVSYTHLVPGKREAGVSAVHGIHANPSQLRHAGVQHVVELEGKHLDGGGPGGHEPAHPHPRHAPH